MKKTLKTFLFTALVAVSLNSCTDKCKDVDCGTYGSCDEGDCLCDEGYSKDEDGKCTVDDNERVIINVGDGVLLDVREVGF